MRLAGGNREIVEERGLARIEGAGLHGGEQRLRLVGLGLDHHPATEAVVRLEVGVVGGVAGEPVAIVEKLLEEIDAVAAAGLDQAAVVEDLDRVGVRRHGAAVLYGEAGPGGMRDADEGAGRLGAGREHHAGFIGGASARNRRQAGGQDVQISPWLLAGAWISAAEGWW